MGNYTNIDPKYISGALYEREYHGSDSDAHDEDEDDEDDDDDDDDDDMMLTPMRTTRMITMRRPTTALTMMLISSDFVRRPTFGQHSPGNSMKGRATMETLNRNSYPI